MLNVLRRERTNSLAESEDSQRKILRQHKCVSALQVRIRIEPDLMGRIGFSAFQHKVESNDAPYTSAAQDCRSIPEFIVLKR